MKNETAKVTFDALLVLVATFFKNVVLSKRTRAGLINSKETALGNASNLNAYRAIDNLLKTFQKVYNLSRKDADKFDIQKTAKHVLTFKKLDEFFVERIAKDAKDNDVIVKRDANSIDKAKRNFKSGLRNEFAKAFNYDDDTINSLKTFDFSDKQVLAWIKVNARFFANLTEYVQPVRIVKANGDVIDAKKQKPSASAKERRQSAKNKTMAKSA